MVQAASEFLIARELPPAMATCRALLHMLPRTVAKLDGFVLRATDAMVTMTMSRFSFATSVNLSGSSELTRVTSWPATLTAIDVSGCRELRDESIIAIANH